MRVCRLLLGDPDDMVVKAMSWSLRELAKRDPKIVAAFLVKEEARLSSRVKREVLNKLRTGVKSPRPWRALTLRLQPPRATIEASKINCARGTGYLVSLNDSDDFERYEIAVD